MMHLQLSSTFSNGYPPPLQKKKKKLRKMVQKIIGAPPVHRNEYTLVHTETLPTSSCFYATLLNKNSNKKTRPKACFAARNNDQCYTRSVHRYYRDGASDTFLATRHMQYIPSPRPAHMASVGHAYMWLLLCSEVSSPSKALSKH